MAMEFSFNRCVRLAQKEITENQRSYLSMLLVLFLVAIGFTLVYTTANIVHSFAMVSAFLCTAYYSFEKYRKTAARITSLLTPASAVEKYVCTFCLNYVLLPVLLFAFFIFGLWVGNLMFDETLFGNPTMLLDTLKRMEFEPLLLLMFLAAQSACFYGSLFFRKHAMSNVFGVLMLFVIYVVWLTEKLPTSADAYGCFETLNGIIFGVAAVVFLVLAFFRLKEERV